MDAVQYSVDIVLCIDATGSMSPIINQVKDNALRFYDNLAKNMEEKNKAIDSLRVRTVVFRDYYVPGEEAMRESPFYSLPQEKEDFSRFISTIRAEGGGDAPECGLEALALAMKSDWSRTGDRKRQIVVVWTDTSAHPLEKEKGDKPSHYPADMPKNLDEITDLWDGQGPMSSSAKRLVIFAPDADPWSGLATNWTNALHYPSRAGDGLSDIEFKTILEAIANSV